MYPYRFPKAVVVAFTVILLLCSFSGTALAVPNLISYQGKLANAGNTPLEGTYSMTFSIYDAANNGTAIWTETQNVAVSGGVYTVLLGSVTGLVPANFTSDQLYLQVQVGTEVLTPRQRLATTPFAFRAATAETVTLPSNGVISIGDSTLIHTTGSGNFFAGSGSGNLGVTGIYNTANGYYALNANTSGGANTANGATALYNNTTGYSNTAIGAQSLYSNLTGYFNTATGVQTLFVNTTGYANTASGFYALHSNTEGNSNTASGLYALYSNTVGNTNTASGAYALYNNTTLGGNTASGYYALYNNTGYANTASGSSAGSTNTTGNNNTFMGAYSDAAVDNISNATAIGYSAIVDASNHVRIGNTSVTQIGGQVAWSNLSDSRIKKDIIPISYGLDFITALKPVQYRMRNGNDRLDFGFIAQDIETLLGDSYNLLGIASDADRTLSLRYTDFIAPMVKAMQEQQVIIKHQEETISAMRSELDALKAAIAAIRAGRQ
jgi:hypothetical protein